jgi:hypothetical protein
LNRQYRRQIPEHLTAQVSRHADTLTPPQQPGTHLLIRISAVALSARRVVAKVLLDPNLDNSLIKPVQLY